MIKGMLSPVFIYDGVCGAGHRIPAAEAPGQAPDQGCFACPQAAQQRQHPAAGVSAGQVLAKGFRLFGRIGIHLF